MPIRYGWTLDQKDWNHLVHLCSERGITATTRWREVTLAPESRTSVAEKPGVYFIVAQASHQGDELGFLRSIMCPIYIGKADSSLRDRFGVHLRGQTPLMRRAHATYSQLLFCSLETSSPEQLEDALVRVFGPPVNMKNVRSISANIGNRVNAGSL